MVQRENSNFTFLHAAWAFLYADATQVEHYAHRDPRAVAIYARRTLELALKWLFENDTTQKSPCEKSLATKIFKKRVLCLWGVLTCQYGKLLWPRA